MRPELIRQAKWRRPLVKLMVVVLTLSFAIDSLPEPVALRGHARTTLTLWQTKIGIWQGPWSMFAPNPVVAHTWLSAEIYDAQGEHVQSWNSPYWPNESAWRKFREFRSMNFYSRLCYPEHKDAAEDFGEYLARSLPTETGGPPVVDLYSNSYKLATPMDGRILPTDELVWVSQSRQVYDPWPEATPEQSLPSSPFSWRGWETTAEEEP